jgi:hypothetical protein
MRKRRPLVHWWLTSALVVTGFSYSTDTALVSGPGCTSFRVARRSAAGREARD